MKIKTIFFGTPEFAVESLDALIKAGIEVAAVVTTPDKPAGRGIRINQSDIKKYALEHGLPILQPEKLKSPEFISALREINADLFIVIAFRMLPEIVWQMPRLGTFNLHASLLPKYRGAAPINHAVINGETKTGVTTFFLKHEIDTGDIISQDEIDILPEDNAGTIHDKLMTLGACKVVETVKAIENGTLRTFPQPEGDFVPAPKIFKDTCRIDWNNSSVKIHNLVRGLSPYPAAWSHLFDSAGKEFDVKIFETAIPSSSELKHPLSPGEVKVEGHSLFVGTQDGVLQILSLQPAGKKRMDASAFLLGYKPLRLE
ncbi:MAG: methionyl-tRNA formyltransferase [Muribaculaceae bacterium]|nr:methionyl-tRNA formyltransferase [Muribaculaceae bacterium]